MIDVKWFRQQLAERGLSQRAAARLLGLDQSAISLTMTGKRRMHLPEAAAFAALLGLPVSDVLRHLGMPVDQGQQTVPLCSTYDGHGESHCIGVENAERIVPPQPMPEGSTAMQCRTAGSPLEHMDGWVLFCGPPQQQIPLGQFCRVCLRSGMRLLGVIRRGYRAGRYNVVGPAGVVENAEVDWVQPVITIQT